MKIKVHNSLALTKKVNYWTRYMLNDTCLAYYSKDEELFFWTKSSASAMGHLNKDGSLKEYSYIDLDPFNMKLIKSWKWKELK